MKKRIENHKLKIAMIGHKIVPSRRGGIELVLTTMCPLLVKRGHSVVCYNRAGGKVENEYIGTVEDDYYKGVHLQTVWTINQKGLAAMSSSFFASLKAGVRRYDVIHYHAEGPCAMMWIPKLFGRRCVATVHGLDWQREKWKSGFGAKYIKFGEKVLAKYADEVIVLSRGVQQYFKDTYGRDTVFIPNGVSRPKRGKPKLITEQYGLQGNDYFCAVARLTEEKGIHYLIEAYQKMHTDKKLLIAGDSSDTDDYVKRLKEMAGGNPDIIFTGFVSGDLLDEIYSNAYVYILPSNLEGMPLSLLEAMSYGNAVIGSSIPEIADVVEDKALIFEKSNVDDLAEKMQMLEDRPDLVKRYQAESADYICGKYNWEEVVEKTLRVYQKEIYKNDEQKKVDRN